MSSMIMGAPNRHQTFQAAWIHRVKAVLEYIALLGTNREMWLAVFTMYLSRYLKTQIPPILAMLLATLKVAQALLVQVQQLPVLLPTMIPLPHHFQALEMAQ